MPGPSSSISPPSAEAEAIGKQTGKLQFLLDALVKLSRCEGGLIEENVHPVMESVEALTAQALSAIIPAAEKKSIVFSGLSFCNRLVQVIWRIFLVLQAGKC